MYEPRRGQLCILSRNMLRIQRIDYGFDPVSMYILHYLCKEKTLYREEGLTLRATRSERFVHGATMRKRWVPRLVLQIDSTAIG